MADKTHGPTIWTALIMPLSSHATFPKPTPPPGGTTPPLPGTPPPVVDNTLPGDLPHPEHPIYYPLPPDVPPPVVDNTLPGAQPHPEHPIVLPPGGSGGWLPVYIDNTLPGVDPGWSGGVAPPGQEGGAPRPTHPIVLPPEGTAPPEVGGGKITWKAIWTPDNGWQVAGIVIPSGPIPTPSKKK